MARAARIRSQLGLGGTPGSPAAATVQLPGLLTMRHAPNRLLREEYRNSWGGSNVHDDLRLESTGQYVGRCTTSTLPYWLSAGMRGGVTPTTVLTSGKQWAFVQPLTEIPVPALQQLTAYWGDADPTGGSLCAPGTVVTRIVIEGANDAAWTIRADLLGMGTEPAAFNAALTTISNETVKNLLSSIFIGGDWATIMAATPTASPGVAYGFTWTYDAGVAGDFTMSNSLTRTDLHRDIPNTTLQLRLKWSAEAQNLAVHHLNNARRFIRLKNEGSIISGGTAKNTIDIAGAYDLMTMDTVADQTDGTVRSTLDLVAVEDSGREVEVTVTNALASL